MTSAQTPERKHCARKATSIALIGLGALLLTVNAVTVIITGSNLTGHVVLPDDGVISIAPTRTVGWP